MSTREEFIAKYGTVNVRFSSYYKYSFTYSGTLPDGSTISVRVGGNSDDIYRMEVNSAQEETLAGLDPYAGRVDLNGKEVDSFFDY